MEQVSLSELRQDLEKHLDKVRGGRAPLLVTMSGGEDVVVMSRAEYESLEETLYLLSDPANAEHLLRSIADADAGRLTEHDLIE